MSQVADRTRPESVSRSFVPKWRRERFEAFDLERTSSAGRAVEIELWGRPIRIYANANLSIYSGQTCNARCPFCVEEVRPASRGASLIGQKRVERDDETYFGALEEVLEALSPLDPSVSVTGGEASLDPRLPRILRTIRRFGCRKRTLTTNGSGLLRPMEGSTALDWILRTGVKHLNISRAHPEQEVNARLMGLVDQLPMEGLEEVVRRTQFLDTRVRLSCVLLRNGISSFVQLLEYLRFARAVGVDNVVFRQLMRTDPMQHPVSSAVRHSNRERVPLGPILDQVERDLRFTFVRQIVGYYYYVEVWRAQDIDVVFEEADLGRLERTKRLMPNLVHELIFHPNGRLASTWQPWDGVLGPPGLTRGSRPASQPDISGGFPCLDAGAAG